MEKYFNSINEIQAIQNDWERKLVDEDGRTPQERFNRFLEEVQELREAISLLDEEDNYENRLNAALEVADVMIISLSIAEVLGFDIERLIYMKLERNFYKYNPERAQELKEKGLTWQEVIQLMKQEWNEKKA